MLTFPWCTWISASLCPDRLDIAGRPRSELEVHGALCRAKSTRHVGQCYNINARLRQVKATFSLECLKLVECQ